MEFRNVSKPFLIRGRGFKVSIDDVFRRWTDFPQLRPVSTLSIDGNDQAFLLHQTSYDFLGEVYLLATHCRSQSPVSIAPPITLE